MTNNTNNNGISNSLRNIQQQKAEYAYQKLIKEHDRLLETILSKTMKEELEDLSANVEEQGKSLVSIVQGINKELSMRLSAKDVEGSLKRLDNRLKKAKRDLEKLQGKPDDEKKKKDEIKQIEKAITELRNKHTDYLTSANRLQAQLNRNQLEGITILDDYNDKWEERSKAFRKGFNEVKSGTTQAFNAIKGLLEPWSKAQTEALSYAKTMGMSQKTADAYLKRTTEWASKNEIGVLFNKTTDELIKMQSRFSETLGRNVQLTGEQKKDMLAMEKFLGEDGMMDIANNLENFGLGMSDSADFVKKTLDDATKSGIAASKLTKTIRENIKMAQNYTFKNGLDGLKSMAKKAIELKTDMSLINQLAEKTSTVEGAITTGANLQVLGGSYAMGSDPLSMMYESLNDMEGLFDRATNMAKGKVFYNEQTGNFEMGAMDRYLMKQAATVMGVDPSKMIEAAYRQASLGKIESQAKLNSNISGDEDMMSLVKNLATWDKGEAVIDINGKRTRVSDLQTSDKETLEAMQKTDSQNLQDMAISLRGIQDIMQGTNKEIQNEQANIMSSVGQGLTNLMRNSTGLLDGIAKIGAWGATLSGISAGVYGILTTILGGARMGRGIGNIFSSKPSGGMNVGKSVRGGGSNISNLAGKRITAKTTGEQFKINKNGTATSLSNPSKTLNKGSVTNMVNSGSKISGLGSSALKTVGGGVGAGVLAGGLSLASDMASGNYAKDKEKSWINAGGTAIGAGIGMIFGPVGAMVGAAIGGAVGGLVTNIQEKEREKERKEIADWNPELAHFFVGENALQGNYSKSDLHAIKEALSDNKISSGELSDSLISKMSANDDINRLKQNGVKVSATYASGGYVHGNSHQNGGVDIEAEGGEFIINKLATKKYLPILKGINNGNIKMTPKQPLGEQMKVSDNSNSVEVKSTKIEIPPVSINLSGTIKLDTGNKQVDITNELIKNPVLINKLTDMISKQLNILENGAYNKTKFKQKFS